ncbi:ATP-binding cassette domain-containing protein [Cytobacillus dafuensis]|uniref:ABC transporter ATP-binding protein n=1 Tax=Cytobacillus dafuensis TaxID=1742359 RepID=A0A5B8ZEP8_CYTDA|nr:ABC transporter ATP-binding protein [Cytobacillus dafuensis]QED49986.1 ABC transporter ATP-binding protein [Cytobacillus dafuensis]
MENWIEINRVRKKIDDFQLGPIDVSFEPGTITTIVGNNGAGKSTLLKLLMHLAPINEGEIKVFDQAVNGQKEDWKRKIAYLPQTVIGCDSFSGKQLKELVSKWYPTWNQSIFDEIVEKYRIPLTKKYGELSQGVQQKLNLALTLARDTDILILDEPTAHMDIPAKQMLMDLLVQWMDCGEKLMIISTHQIEDIRKLADYLVIVREGQLIGKFEKEELSGRYKRYWMEEALSNETIPGEIDRKNGRILVSNRFEETEQFLTNKHLSWLNEESLEIEEIITYMLTDRNKKEDKIEGK